MKKLSFVSILLFTSISTLQASHQIGFVSLKRCMEESLLGKHETEEIESLKQKFMSNAEQMEKDLQTMYNKLQDEDYMESLSSSASSDLQRKFEELSNEYNAYQSQYYQLMNQQNYKRVQNLIKEVKSASEEIRATLGFDVILNEEAILAIHSDADATDDIIKVLDKKFSKK